ncbi:helix-turn-helix transcriptional regulator [Puerhibacterium puerhi]|uniref:helix-turn-helix transcriptional regulator n=1 Tax=Puerhibacterium puerhi TaxID=2692623 RepID=UPI00135A90F1|nr:helix-turn-helix transcriptional regulator [Puerhibacterium puerhi]
MTSIPVRTNPASPYVDGAVRAALSSGDLDALEDLSDRLWYQLPARYARPLLDALAEVPPRRLTERPRLLVTGLLAHRFLHADDPAEVRRVERSHALHGSRTERRLGAYAAAPDAVTAGVLAMQAARWRGDHEAAERVARLTEARAGARRRPGLVALQRGLGRVAADDAAGAVEHLERAYAQAGPAPFQHFAGAAACGVLAMLAAERGHHRLAAAWLDRLAALGPVPRWLDRYLLTGAFVAEALLAIDRLDRPAAEQALARAGEGTDATDLWPHVAAAWLAYELTFRGPTDAFVRLDAAGFAHGVGRRPQQGDPAVLLRAYADLLVVSGEGTYVLAVLGDVSRRPDLAAAAAAVHLRAGQRHQAVAVAARALRHPAASPRDLQELQLVLAVAHLFDGEADSAARSFRSALELWVHGLGRAFTVLPHETLAELCRLTGTDPAELITPTGARPRPRAGLPLAIVVLTDREREVLRALADGSTTSDVARALHVSTNTVRTHVKSLYRKLGVQSRDAALARGAALGFLVG